ncbi:MAG: hypothetical protein J6X65_06160 [Bacteroidales bacterium]|nr:hypothetical protein [Bacteroidales bacterium]
MFNKPFGVLSQFTPEGGHRALDEFGFPAGVYAAGRLDHDSEGALLLTDDGRLIKQLLDPKNAHPRTYLAQVEMEGVQIVYTASGHAKWHARYCLITQRKCESYSSFE